MASTVRPVMKDWYNAPIVKSGSVSVTQRNLENIQTDQPYVGDVRTITDEVRLCRYCQGVLKERTMKGKKIYVCDDPQCVKIVHELYPDIKVEGWVDEQ